MATLEIYLIDLKPQMQKKVLGLYNYECAIDGNLDIQPLFILESEENGK